MVELVDFTEPEVSEMQRYIETHVHHTILQRVYVLSEDPLDKSSSFIIIYRILLSCKNYASTDELRNKLDILLTESLKTYDELYPLVLRYLNYSISYGKSELKDSILDVLCDIKKNKEINKTIDAFLVFGEKIELNRADDFMGLDLETDHGKEAMKEIRKIVESENI